MSENDAKSKRDLYIKFVKRLIKYQGLYKNSYKYQVIFDRIEQEIEEVSGIQSNSEHPIDEFLNLNIPNYLLNFASKINFLRSTSVAEMQTDILRNNSNGLIDIIPIKGVPRNNRTDIGPFVFVPENQHLLSTPSSICVFQSSQENKKNINISELTKEKREIYQIVCRPLSVSNMQNLIIYHTLKHIKLLKIQPKSEASDIEDNNQFEIAAKHCLKLKNIKHFTTNLFNNDYVQNPNPIFYEPRVFALSQSGNIASFDCNSGVLSNMCEKSPNSPSNSANREGISSISPNILIHFGGKNVSVIDMRLSSSKTPSGHSSNQIYSNSVANIQSDYGDVFCLQKSQYKSLNFYLTSRNNVELFDLRKANNSLKSTDLSLFGYPDLTDVLLGPNTSANSQNTWEEYLAVACRDSNETRVIKIDKSGQNMTVSYLKNISNFDVDNSVTVNGVSGFEEIKKPNLCGLKFQNCNNVPQLYQYYSNNSILSSHLLDDINEWKPDSKISLSGIKTQNYDENESYIDADSFSLSNFIRGMNFKPRDAHPLCLVCNSNEIFVSKSQATESHEDCPKCGLNQSQQAALKSGIDNELLTLDGMGNQQHVGDLQEAWNLDDNWDPGQYEDIPSQFVNRLFYDKNADLSDIQ
ncbi:MAG: hypothetical protein MHMPM18_002722, partial [Marteilia pararefringens]